MANVKDFPFFGNGQVMCGLTRYKAWVFFDVNSEPTYFYPPRNSPWKSFTSGQSHIYGTTWDNRTYYYPRLDPDFRVSPRYIPPPKDATWEKFYCGWNYTIALDTNGEAHLWEGPSEWGSQPGIKTSSSRIFPCPDHSRWIKFYNGGYFIIGISLNYNVYMYGTRRWLGYIEHKENPIILRPYPWIHFYCGKNHVIGVTLNRNFYAWGNNTSNQIGMVTKELIESHPLKIPDPQHGGSWRYFVCGNEFTIGLTDNDNEIYVWGTYGDVDFGVGYFKTEFLSQLDREITLGIGNKMIGVRDGIHFFILYDQRIGWYTKFIEIPDDTPWCFPSFQFPIVDDICDTTIVSSDNESIPIVSHLVYSRCPILKNNPHLTRQLSRKVWTLLLDITYCSTIDHNSYTWEEIFQLYSFVKTHRLWEDYEMEFYWIVETKLEDILESDQAEEFFKALSLVGRLDIDPKTSLLLDAFYMSFSNVDCTDEELCALVQKYKLDSAIVSKFDHLYIPIVKTPIHRPSIFDLLETLIKGQQFDVEIVSKDGDRFRAFKFVLSTKSEYFRNLFRFDACKKETYLEMLSTPSLGKLLEYFHRGFVPEMTVEESFEILMARDFLCLEDDDLIRSCHQNCLPRKENYEELLQLSIKHDQTEKVSEIYEFISSSTKK